MLESSWCGKNLTACTDLELAEAATPTDSECYFENESGLPDDLAIVLFEAIASRILQRRHQ